MMGNNNDFLSSTFVGSPFEEYPPFFRKHYDVGINRQKKKTSNQELIHNYRNALDELKELREYKKMASQQLKKYETSIYSFKNQIRNMKKNMFSGGDINIQLTNIFINLICDIIEHLCSDVNCTVFSALKEIYMLLSHIPLRDKKIYECTKLVRTTLIGLSDKNSCPLFKITEKNADLEVKLSNTDLENENFKFLPNHIQDLDWLSSEMNDKGWLTVSDRWIQCKRDLKWLCVNTNNRTWLLYRQLWNKAPNDLRYICVLFNDKKWLNLHSTWNLVPLNLKMKAILSKNPDICKPSINELVTQHDGICELNLLNLNDDISDLINRNSKNYKYFENKNMYAIKKTFNPSEFVLNNEDERLTAFSKILCREHALQNSLNYNLLKNETDRLNNEELQLNLPMKNDLIFKKKEEIYTKKNITETNELTTSVIISEQNTNLSNEIKPNASLTPLVKDKSEIPTKLLNESKLKVPNAETAREKEKAEKEKAEKEKVEKEKVEKEKVEKEKVEKEKPTLNSETGNNKIGSKKMGNNMLPKNFIKTNSGIMTKKNIPTNMTTNILADDINKNVVNNKGNEVAIVKGNVLEKKMPPPLNKMIPKFKINNPLKAPSIKKAMSSAEKNMNKISDTKKMSETNINITLKTNNNAVDKEKNHAQPVQKSIMTKMNLMKNIEKSKAPLKKVSSMNLKEKSEGINNNITDDKNILPKSIPVSEDLKTVTKKTSLLLKESIPVNSE